MTGSDRDIGRFNRLGRMLIRSMTVKHELLTRLILLSLFIAGFFGINSMFFFLSQRALSDVTEAIEDTQALSQSVALDRRYFTGSLKTAAQTCGQEFPARCEHYIEMLISLVNRNEDYQVTLSKTFQATPDSAITHLLAQNSELARETVRESFGLSLSAAKQKGIRSPDEYMEYVTKRRSEANPTSFKQLSSQLSPNTAALFESMEKFAADHLETLPKLGEVQSRTQIFYAALVVFEISLYCLVGGLEVFKTVTSEPYQEQGPTRKS